MLRILLPIIIVIVAILLGAVGYAFYAGKKILDVIFEIPTLLLGLLKWIFSAPKRVLTWLGFYDPEPEVRTDEGPSGPPSERIIIKEKECPPCPACKCPECPDCKCPECPKCDCPVRDAQLESSQAEVDYLKWMSRFLGSLVRRENAMNRALMEQCPGLYGVVPFVQQVDSEVNFLKNHIKKDRGAWEYFQKYFTRYSGIPIDHYHDIIL